jgi:transcriptional regulator of acetoin/glycerol metabolism
VALSPGASWAETARGTNAVGTALIERKPIVVRGGEHYLRHNGFLACAAAPLLQPDGRLLGVVDISCDARNYHPHSFGLVRAAAQMIETRLFELNFIHHTKLRFHSSGNCLGSVMEGAVAIDEDGRILGATRPGMAILGLTPEEIGQRNICDYFDLILPALMGLGMRPSGETTSVRLRQGGRLYLSVEQMRPPRAAPPRLATPAAACCDILTSLDTGDARMAKAIGQLRCVLGRKVPIVLQGETGTGKDVLARAIHAAGPRAAGPFVAVNCATLPAAAIEAELFGLIPGALPATAAQAAPGRLREAHGGTLFLDEIDDMPLELQARLLRVLVEGIILPPGSKPVPVDFLLIAATRTDLSAQIAAKRFRADLYYRLNGLTVILPPLRERSDLGVLLGRILAHEAAALGRPTPVLAPELVEIFTRYRWPGNLRELANTLRTACLLLGEDEEVLDLRHLDEAMRGKLIGNGPGMPTAISGTSLRECSDAVIATALAEANGNITAAARRLGISRTTLYRRLHAQRH